jgi:hypothetical protein
MPACVVSVERRLGRGAGHPLEILAPAERDLPTILNLPGRRRRRATPAGRGFRPGRLTGPDHRSGAAAAPATLPSRRPGETGPTAFTGPPGDAATSTAVKLTTTP